MGKLKTDFPDICKVFAQHDTFFFSPGFSFLSKQPSFSFMTKFWRACPYGPRKTSRQQHLEIIRARCHVVRNNFLAGLSSFTRNFIYCQFFFFFYISTFLFSEPYKQPRKKTLCIVEIK